MKDSWKKRSGLTPTHAYKNNVKYVNNSLFSPSNIESTSCNDMQIQRGWE